MTTKDEQSERWALPFFTLWGGQALSLLGSRVAGFALVWWLTEQTGSAIVLSTMTIMFFLPQILLGPFAGALIDRWDRKWVMFVADSVTALASAILALLFWGDQLQTWHIYMSTFVGSLAGAFHFSAMMASTSLMVPEEHLTRVQGANQMLQGLMTIAAPPLGALVVGLLPFAAIMALDVVTALFAIAPLLFITVPRPKRSETDGFIDATTPAALWRDVRGGFRYIWSWPGLFFTTLLALVINMVATPLGTLLPILVTVNFQGDAFQLGWIELTLGVGMLAGGILLGVWGGFRKKALMFPVGVFGFAAASVMLAVSPWFAFWLAMVGMGIFGIMSSMLNGTLMALLQAQVAPDMQGRVFTALNSGTSAAAPLGLLLAGPVADLWGAPIWFAGTGVVLFVVGITILFIPAVMNLGEEETEKQIVDHVPTLQDGKFVAIEL